MFGTSIPPLGREDLHRDMENMSRKLEAKKSLGDALLDLMLLTAPEERKTELLIMKEYNNIASSAQSLVEAFALNTPGDLTPELIEAQKAVLDYMGTVAEGLKQYYEEALKVTQLDRK